MAISDLVAQNEELIKDAINEGISKEAVNSTLEDVINKSEEVDKIPSQVKEVVETIVDMKSEEDVKVDESYASEYVRQNNEKIKSALESGITPSEVANTLVDSTKHANSRKGKRRLNFIVKLISKMKKKELKLEKENVQEKGYQKIISK